MHTTNPTTPAPQLWHQRFAQMDQDHLDAATACLVQAHQEISSIAAAVQDHHLRASLEAVQAAWTHLLAYEAPPGHT